MGLGPGGAGSSGGQAGDGRAGEDNSSSGNQMGRGGDNTDFSRANMDNRERARVAAKAKAKKDKEKQKAKPATPETKPAKSRATKYGMIGAKLGALVGGPLGAVFGAVAGFAIGTAVSSNTTSTSTNASTDPGAKDELHDPLNGRDAGAGGDRASSPIVEKILKQQKENQSKKNVYAPPRESIPELARRGEFGRFNALAYGNPWNKPNETSMPDWGNKVGPPRQTPNPNSPIGGPDWRAPQNNQGPVFT